MSQYARTTRQKEMTTTRSLTGFAICCLLLLLLNGCGYNTSTSSTSGQQASHQQTAATATPNIPLGEQVCPTTVSAKDYWEAVTGVQREQNSIAKVSCAHLKGDMTLQALVIVQYNGASGGVKDVYVYDQITSPAPTKILELKDLYQGDALISGYNTVLTREVDWNSAENKDQAQDTVQPDLYREFKWATAAGGMLPVAFRGLYPDITRYQAEEDQRKVTTGGQDKWKLNALQVAQHMGSALLQWPDNSKGNIISQNGVDAVVHLTGPSGGTLTITLSRLEGRANGIWLVTNVTSPTLQITKPAALDRLTRNFTISGKGTASKDVIGEVKVLDHLYHEVGSATAQGKGSGTITFSTNVSYTSTFAKGSEDGIIALFTRNGSGTITNAVLFKTLLG